MLLRFGEFRMKISKLRRVGLRQLPLIKGQRRLSSTILHEPFALLIIYCVNYLSHSLQAEFSPLHYVGVV